jgi:hypothetical protein
MSAVRSASGGKSENNCSLSRLTGLTRSRPRPAIGWLQIFVIRPYSDTAHIAVPGCGTLHFAECGRITEIWSEVHAASRRQHLARRSGRAL